MHECSTVNEKSSLCPSPSPSGGECSGVKPHCTAHSAAPQVRAGHCSCGGQHLRVLQRGLNQRGVSCFFPTSHLFLLLTAAFFPNKSYLGMMPTEAKPFLKHHYCWKGVKSRRAKDVNLWSTIFLFFFVVADLGMPRNDPKCFPLTQTDLQSGSTLQGTRKRFTLKDVTVSGTYRQPWWQPEALNPFLKGQWEPMMHCTVL